MSLDHSIYIGVYFRIYLPIEQEIVGRRCSICSKEVYTNYCPDHGVKPEAIEGDTPIDFYTLCEEIFGDQDRFASTEMSDEDCIFVTANQYDQPGHLEIDHSEGEYNLPKEDYSGDWELLAEALDDRSIRYEKCFGVLSYYY